MKGNPFEGLIEKLSDAIVTQITSMPEHDPLGSKKLTKAEQKERYAEIRDKPEAWTELFEKQPLSEVVQYAVTKEREYRDEQGPERQQSVPAYMGERSERPALNPAAGGDTYGSLRELAGSSGGPVNGLLQPTGRNARSSGATSAGQRSIGPADLPAVLRGGGA